MAEDAATVEQLRAELRLAREENDALRADGEHRDRALAEVLGRQRGASEILCLISGSPADLPTVLHTLVINAGRLCDTLP